MLQHGGADSWSLQTLPDPGDQLQCGGLHLQQQQQRVPLLFPDNRREQTIQVKALIVKFRSLWQLIIVAFETILNKPTLYSRHAYLAALQKFEWKKVASLTQDGSKYSRYMSSLQDTWKKDKAGINFILNRKFPRDTKDMSMVSDIQYKSQFSFTTLFCQISPEFGRKSISRNGTI